MHAFAGSRALD